MRTGRSLDSRRTRQLVVLQKFALWATARFNPSRDSAGCTIVMRWQRRLKSYFFAKTKLFSCNKPRHGSCFPRAFLTGRRFTAIPNRRAYANEKEILLTWCTTIWRTTTRRARDRYDCLTGFARRSRPGALQTRKKHARLLLHIRGGAP